MSSTRPTRPSLCPLEAMYVVFRIIPPHIGSSTDHNLAVFKVPACLATAHEGGSGMACTPLVELVARVETLFFPNQHVWWDSDSYKV